MIDIVSRRAVIVDDRRLHARNDRSIVDGRSPACTIYPGIVCKAEFCLIICQFDFRDLIPHVNGGILRHARLNVAPIGIIVRVTIVLVNRFCNAPQIVDGIL